VAGGAVAGGTVVAGPSSDGGTMIAPPSGTVAGAEDVVVDVVVDGVVAELGGVGPVVDGTSGSTSRSIAGTGPSKSSPNPPTAV
jgi:hypothetical protein